MAECAFGGCARKAVCKGLCDKHYRRVLKHGDVNYERPDLSPKPRPCIICGSIFTPSRHHKDARFCSKKCIGSTPENKERCSERGKQYRKQIGDTQRGRGEGKAYRKYLGRHEHRKVAEEMLGRPLVRGEVIHHKDGNKLNNCPDNLVITTQSLHMKEHGLGIPGMKLRWKPWEKRGNKNGIHA